MNKGISQDPFRLRVRAYAGDELRFDELIIAPVEEADKIILTMAEKHALALADVPHTIELEFLNEPDPNERFFRMGTDPSRMYAPISVSLEDLKKL